MPSCEQEIGGYFELEAASSRPGHDATHLGSELIRLNSGRNCLRAVLISSGVRRIYLPDYLCETLVQAVRSCAVEPVFYQIDDQLRPRTAITCGDDELWLGVNYFGLMSQAVISDAGQTPRYVADNCQAYFAPPVTGAISFYSPRKFFGVPDGGYLVGTTIGTWPGDDSRGRMDHLLIRSRQDARTGYPAYQAHEEIFADLPVRAMSALTQTLMATVDAAAAAAQRVANYRLLNAALAEENDLSSAVTGDETSVPLVYPFLNTAPDLRAALNRAGVFAASYWPDCLKRSECGPSASHLARCLTALPIDQRYGPDQMKQIIGLVHRHLADSRVRMVVS